MTGYIPRLTGLIVCLLMSSLFSASAQEGHFGEGISEHPHDHSSFQIDQLIGIANQKARELGISTAPLFDGVNVLNMTF